MNYELSRRGALLSLLVAPMGCRRNRQAPVDAGEAARVEANVRLQGAWLLLDFTPTQAPEPMLGALLAAQLGTMTIDFDGTQMHAVGTGVQTTRRYRVMSAHFARLEVRTFDDMGVSYDAVGEFRANELWFESRTSPWHGRGVLRRR